MSDREDGEISFTESRRKVRPRPAVVLDSEWNTSELESDSITKARKKEQDDKKKAEKREARMKRMEDKGGRKPETSPPSDSQQSGTEDLPSKSPSPPVKHQVDVSAVQKKLSALEGGKSQISPSPPEPSSAPRGSSKISPPDSPPPAKPQPTSELNRSHSKEDRGDSRDHRSSSSRSDRDRERERDRGDRDKRDRRDDDKERHSSSRRGGSEQQQQQDRSSQSKHHHHHSRSGDRDRDRERDRATAAPSGSSRASSVSSTASEVRRTHSSITLPPPPPPRSERSKLPSALAAAVAAALTSRRAEEKKESMVSPPLEEEPTTATTTAKSETPERGVAIPPPTKSEKEVSSSMDLDRERDIQEKQPSLEREEREGSEPLSPPPPPARENPEGETSDNELSRIDAEDERMAAEAEIEDEEEEEEMVGLEDPRVSQLLPGLTGCRSVDCFERLNRISEGTYGVVYRARDRQTNEIVALKKIKMDTKQEGFPVTSLREIDVLLRLKHANIVEVKEVVVGSKLDSIFMVMEFMEHDMKALMDDMTHPFTQSEVKCLLHQLLLAVSHMHDNWVLHRDLKTSNLLFNNKGILKVCDFGMARHYGSPLRPYTQLVVTLWYRAPELLLGTKEYSTAVDMWSVGCIFAEMLQKKPLFPATAEAEAITRIFKELGTPNEDIWPGFNSLPMVKKFSFAKNPFSNLRNRFPPHSPIPGTPTLSEHGFDLLRRMLTYDPNERISADEALSHPYFNEAPLPKSLDMMPTFPSLHEDPNRRKRRKVDADPDMEKLLRG